MAAEEHNGQPIIEFADAGAFEAWLERHHAGAAGVWIKHAKRTAPHVTVTHPQALDVAICFGWIDAQRRPHDERSYLQRYCPRTPRSRWSQVNVAKAGELIAAGRMRPSGLAAIEAAKADGRWEQAYEPQSRSTVPPDFQVALDNNSAAKEFFETLKGQRRYAFLYRLTTIKRPETRARRIEQYVALLAEGKTLR